MNKRPPHMTEQQIAAVESGARRSPYPERDVLLVRLALRTGLDEHRLSRLTVSAFDSSDGTAVDLLHLPVLRGEAATGRTMNLCSAVADAYAAFLARFPNAGCIAFSNIRRPGTSGCMSATTIRLHLLRFQLATLGNRAVTKRQVAAGTDWRALGRMRAVATVAARQQRHAATIARQQARRLNARRMIRGSIAFTR